MRLFKLAVVVLVMVGLFVSVSIAAHKGNVDIMSKDELKARLGDPDIIVLDVRKGTDWRASEFKIKGSIRMEPRNITKADFPKDKILVLYCA